MNRAIRAVLPGPPDQRDRTGDRVATRGASATAWCATTPATACTRRSTPGWSIPHYDEPLVDTVIEVGMTFTIEPMLTLRRPALARLGRRLDGRHQRRQPGGPVRADPGGHPGRRRDPDRPLIDGYGRATLGRRIRLVHCLARHTVRREVFGKALRKQAERYTQPWAPLPLERSWSERSGPARPPTPRFVWRGRLQSFRQARQAASGSPAPWPMALSVPFSGNENTVDAFVPPTGSS